VSEHFFSYGYIAAFFQVSFSPVGYCRRYNQVGHYWDSYFIYIILRAVCVCCAIVCTLVCIWGSIVNAFPELVRTLVPYIRDCVI
jgi:uncharacterized membrane protein